jgi:hypothetical protein
MGYNAVQSTKSTYILEEHDASIFEDEYAKIETSK